MDETNSRDHCRLGFLAALSAAENTLLGGLLVTNQHGRPLEFQCTAPLEPNRIQVLLYGPTLKPYLLNDLIGKTLTRQVSAVPQLILVDSPELLPLRGLIDQPLGYVTGEQPDHAVRMGLQNVTWHTGFPADREAIQNAARSVSREADLLEPFHRVRAALQETVGFLPAAASSGRGAA